MNIFARFNENPAKTLQDIKETKRYGRTHARTHARANMKTVYPLQTKFAGGIIMKLNYGILLTLKAPREKCNWKSVCWSRLLQIIA